MGADRRNNEPVKVNEGPEGVLAEWEINAMHLFYNGFDNGYNPKAPDPLIVPFF